jgi:aliphatic nitrilase
VSSACLDRSLFDALPGLDHDARETLELSPRGVSMVLGPTGEVISDTLCENEGLLYQDIDISACVEPKQFHDVVGYYNRFDVFELNVDRTRLTPIKLSDEADANVRDVAPGRRSEK